MAGKSLLASATHIRQESVIAEKTVDFRMSLETSQLSGLAHLLEVFVTLFREESASAVLHAVSATTKKRQGKQRLQIPPRSLATHMRLLGDQGDGPNVERVK